MHLYNPSCKLVLLSNFDGLSTSNERDLIESVSIAQAQTIYVFQLTAIIQNLTVYVCLYILSSYVPDLCDHNKFLRIILGMIDVTSHEGNKLWDEEVQVLVDSTISYQQYHEGWYWRFYLCTRWSWNSSMKLVWPSLTHFYLSSSQLIFGQYVASYKLDTGLCTKRHSYW